MHIKVKIYHIIILLFSFIAFQHSFLFAQTSTKEQLKVDSLYQLATSTYPTDFEKGKSLALEASLLAKKLKYTSGEGKCLRLLGVIYYYKGEYENSLKQYLQAVAIYEAASDSSGLASVLNELGNYTKKHGTLEKAEGYLQKAKNIYENLNDKGGWTLHTT